MRRPDAVVIDSHAAGYFQAFDEGEEEEHPVHARLTCVSQPKNESL